jgi:hypothetical protein
MRAQNTAPMGGCRDRGYIDVHTCVTCGYRIGCNGHDRCSQCHSLAELYLAPERFRALTSREGA